MSPALPARPPFQPDKHQRVRAVRVSSLFIIAPHAGPQWRPDDWTAIADFDVLNTLRRVGDQHGSKPGEMARASLITTGAMTALLDRLERAGLIRRPPDPADRRGLLVRLTPRGSKVARQALQELIAANQAFPRTAQRTAAGLDRLRAQAAAPSPPTPINAVSQLDPPGAAAAELTA
jgi:DNA-binding MarR family transcriptional regulator